MAYIFTPNTPLTIQYTASKRVINIEATEDDIFLQLTFNINGSFIKNIQTKTYTPTNVTFEVDFLENKNIENRTGYIEIINKDLDGNVLKYLYYNITQQAAPNKVIFSPNTPYTVGSIGNRYQIDLEANYGRLEDQFEISSDEGFSKFANAIVFNNNYERTARILVATNTNTTDVERTGDLQVKYNDDIYYYQLIQEGNTDVNFYFDKNIVNVNYQGADIINNLNNSNVENIAVSLDDEQAEQWVTILDENNYVIDQNENYGDRSVNVIATGINRETQENITTSFEIKQEGYKLQPICKDYYLVYNNENNDDYLDYMIKYQDEIIFNGKAYKMPDENVINIYLNNSCFPYLQSTPPSWRKTNSLIQMNDYNKRFDIYLGGLDYSEVRSVIFFNDYSYNFDSINNRKNAQGYIELSDPIFDYLDYRQFFIYSLFNVQPSINIDIKYIRTKDDGTETITNYTLNKNSAYTFQDGQLRYQFSKYVKLQFGNKIYDIKETCADYCIYYKNMMGGYDSLLVLGNNKYSDDITRNTYKKNYNNTILTDFQEKQYLNEIKSKVNVYTNYMNDEQSSKMENLYTSNEIYLHNLNTGEIRAVNIDDKTYERKTFQNNGNKKFYFNFDLIFSQDKILR